MISGASKRGTDALHDDLQVQPIGQHLCTFARTVLEGVNNLLGPSPVQREKFSVLFVCLFCFQADISSVQPVTDSELGLQQSRDVNSEEIHVSIPSSLMQPTATERGRCAPPDKVVSCFDMYQLSHMTCLHNAFSKKKKKVIYFSHLCCGNCSVRSWCCLSTPTSACVGFKNCFNHHVSCQDRMQAT